MEKTSVSKEVMVRNTEAEGQDIGIGKNRADNRCRVKAARNICRCKCLCGGNGNESMRDYSGHNSLSQKRLENSIRLDTDRSLFPCPQCSSVEKMNVGIRHGKPVILIILFRPYAEGWFQLLQI